MTGDNSGKWETTGCYILKAFICEIKAGKNPRVKACTFTKDVGVMHSETSNFGSGELHGTESMYGKREFLELLDSLELKVLDV